MDHILRSPRACAQTLFTEPEEAETALEPVPALSLHSSSLGLACNRVKGCPALPVQPDPGPVTRRQLWRTEPLDEQATPRCKGSREEPRASRWTGAVWFPHPRGCAPKPRPVSQSQNRLSCETHKDHRVHLFTLVLHRTSLRIHVSERVIPTLRELWAGLGP